MNTKTVLDHAVFQLTPTRTRFELFVVASGVTESVASGLLKPFLLHLQAAEEQLAKGGCSIKLEPPAHKKAPWFTKGTAERFVRFVNSPEVIERGVIIDMELVQLEETIKMQTLTSSRVEDPLLDDSASISLVDDNGLSPYDKPSLLKKMGQDSSGNDSGVGVGPNSKKQLLRALEARRLVLRKEQGMAFARAAAAGFELLHLLQLIMFAECFGASRLREACCNFLRLCNKAKLSGFCIEDLNQDISWALSNIACISILKSLERAVPPKSEEDVIPLKTVVSPFVRKDSRLSDGAIGSDHPSIEGRYQNQLPLSHANLSPPGQVCEWSNSTDVCQGWPAIYTDMNGQCATFYGYNYGYGYSPGSQESFTTLSDMSPSALPCSFYSCNVTSQQPSEAKPKSQLCSSLDINMYPPLKKLQIGHRGLKKSRMAVPGAKSNESFPDGNEEYSTEMSDSSSERSDSSNSSVVLSDGSATRVSSKDSLLRQRFSTAESRKDVNKAALQDVKVGPEVNSKRDSGVSADGSLETALPSFLVPSLDVNSTICAKNNGRVCVDQSSALHQIFDEVGGVQKTQRTAALDDNSVFLFERCSDGSLTSKPKKRLDFVEPETHLKQKYAEVIRKVDDSFFVSSPPVNPEDRRRPAIESEVQGNQIYDNMSKQALKVNLVVSNRRNPDDLLMLPRHRNHESSGISSDVLNIETELRGPSERASTPNSQKKMTSSEPSEERVKKFLDQYNEKREAKLRGEAIKLKRAEREGKLKALKDELDKKKSDFGKFRRPERANLQTEARLRAEKLRMFKADLQKDKKEKEEEEKRRLEGLKAQRQARIAARSNIAGRSNASLANTRVLMSSQPSGLKPSPAANRSSAIQKSRTSLRDTQISSSRHAARSSKEHALWSSSKPAIRQQPKSALSLASQNERASLSSKKAETLKGPQKSTSPSVRMNRGFSAVSGKDAQLGRSAFTGKVESSTILSKQPGSFAGTHSNAPLKRSSQGPPSRNGNELRKSVNEVKLEGKDFLKKGSGTGSSSRSVQKMKLTNALTGSAISNRPHSQPVSRNRFNELPEVSKAPLTAAVCSPEVHSSHSKSSAIKGSRPPLFSGTLQNKAARAKWR